MVAQVLVPAQGCIAGTENITMNWAPIYLRDLYGWDPETKGAYFVTIFFTGYTISRLLSGFLIDAVGDHPGLILWHISNELGGECYCPLCQARFRGWLKEKYHTIDALNHAWWTSFWSHHYDSFDEVVEKAAEGA